jgi:hypothetical protein
MIYPVRMRALECQAFPDGVRRTVIEKSDLFCVQLENVNERCSMVHHRDHDNP